MKSMAGGRMCLLRPLVKGLVGFDVGPAEDAGELFLATPRDALGCEVVSDFP
jgi:hypothetical protein